MTTDYMSYEEAKEQPENGWKYADDKKLYAVVTDSIARQHCLGPEPLYEWAKSNGLSRDQLETIANLGLEINDELVGDVLNDQVNYIEEYL